MFRVGRASLPREMGQFPAMHRRHVLHMLDLHARRQPDQADVAARIRALVEGHEDCLLRTCVPGHVTASAWIVSADGQRCLLTLHRKLGRWLQLGGHVDGDPHPENAALREAREESGLARLRFVETDGLVLPFDLDVHVIPARGDEPEHEHHDIRFLLVAEDGQDVALSHESLALRWFDAQDLLATVHEESVLRMHRKAAARRI